MALFCENAKRWPFSGTALCWRRKEVFMGLLALFLLIILPIIEIYLFIEIGGALGTGWTLLLIVLTAALGVSAMRRQGLAVLQEAQNAQAAGRPPLAAAAHGLLILMGGGLLLLPGFFTDAIGFLCLFRPARLFLISAVLEAFLPHIIRVNFGQNPTGGRSRMGSAQEGPQDAAKRSSGPTPDGQTIEGDYRVDEDETPRPR
jgi:UPF0716 protein FxsA